MFHLRHIRRGFFGLGLLAAMAAAPAAHAAEIHVPGDFPTITIALNNTSDGDTIVIAPGTYFEAIDLGSKKVSLIGSGGPDVTMINAFGLGSCLRITGGQTLDTVIEGLTFGDGLAYRGAGIFINGASATVRNCRFIDNHATLTQPGGSDPGDGGGLFIESGSLILEDCEFFENVAADTGGGAYARQGTTVTMTGCHFEGNVANAGAGLAALGSNLTLSDSTFLLNGTLDATEDGGGFQAVNSTVVIDRCHFEANKVWDDGSAVFARNGSQVELRNSVFVGNVNDEGDSPNATIYSWHSGTTVDVLHCTVVENMAGHTSALRAFGGGAISFHNGIIWGNTGGIDTISTGTGSSVTVSYSVIQDGYAGTGNISIDPMLDADLRPLPGSPAIDAANTFVLLGEDPRDFDGNPRAVDDPDTEITGVPVYGLTADMGAFEFQPAPGGGPDPTCPGDLTGSGSVGVADLLQLLSAWGPCP